MVRVLNLFLVVLVLGALGITSSSCAAKPSSAPENLATVQRGNLTIDITATGNLALSHKEDLAFEMAGIVEDILVKEGDSVKEGQVMAKLDTKAWEDYLETLQDQLTTAKRNLLTKERAVTTAERNLAAKERAVTTAERNLAAKERAVTTKELALRSAQISLQMAEYNLTEIAEVKKAQDAVDDAEYDLKIAQAMWQETIKSESSGVELYYWGDQIVSAKARLAEAEQEKREVLAGSSVKVTTNVAIVVATKKLQVEQAQQQLEDAQIAIEDAQIAIEDARIDVEDAKIAVENAQIAVDDARIAVEDAQQDVADAQKALDEAKALSPEVKAPFAGLVTKINVSGGGEVKKGTVALQIADPTKFETEVSVSEMDIFNVNPGKNATVQVNAMTMLNLPANITRISPTATIQSGVVNYKVKVEVKSPEAVMQERQAARQGMTENITQGAFPERLSPAIRPSNITQEQVQEMMKQRQAGGQQAQAPTTLTSQIAQLKEGLTVTVSIVVDSRNNVLLIPNRALSRSGGQTLVKVSKDGVVESRSIKTGLSDGLNTEVTEGLSAGEQVVIPQTTTTTTTPGQQRPGGFMIPGLGR